MLIGVVIAEAVAIGLLTLLVAGLLRSHADILRGLHSLGVNLDPDADASAAAAGALPARRTAGAGGTGGTMTGKAAADLVGTDIDGAHVAVGVAGTGHDTVLAFLSSGCRSCQSFWDTLRRDPELPVGTRVVAVVRDPTEESAVRIAELAGPDLPVVMSTKAWDEYEVPGSPHVVHVDGESGRVLGEGNAGSWSQVLDMLTQAKADMAPRRAWLPDPTGSGSTGVDGWEQRDNAGRIDAELSAAGIGPDHPSLRPGTMPS
jgi:hypothetical protein